MATSPARAARARRPAPTTPPDLLREVRQLILSAREQVAPVNAGLTLLYWQVGDRIRQEV
jgi:hypothetical protein